MTNNKDGGSPNDMSSAFIEFHSLKFESMNSLRSWEHHVEILPIKQFTDTEDLACISETSATSIC